MVGQEEDGKNHKIGSRHQQSDADLRVAILNDHKKRAACRSEAQLITVDTPTNGASVRKGASSDIFETESIAECRRGLVRDRDAPFFRRARSAQAAGDL